MDMKMILLDVGGTFIKCSDGRQIPIDSSGSRDSIVESLREAVGEADKVAVAIPGPFDYDRGIFLMKHKFAAVYGESFAGIIGGNREFRFIHDVNAMLLGEMASGAVLARIVEPVLEEYKIECLLFGGQISRSFALFGSAVRTGLSDIPELRYIGPVSDIDNAAFNGLKTLHTI